MIDCQGRSVQEGSWSLDAAGWFTGPFRGRRRRVGEPRAAVYYRLCGLWLRTGDGHGQQAAASLLLRLRQSPGELHQPAKRPIPTRFVNVWNGTSLSETHSSVQPSLSETHSTVFSPIQSIQQQPPTLIRGLVGESVDGWMRTGTWLCPSQVPHALTSQLIKLQCFLRAGSRLPTSERTPNSFSVRSAAGARGLGMRSDRTWRNRQRWPLVLDIQYTAGICARFGWPAPAPARSAARRRTRPTATRDMISLIRSTKWVAFGVAWSFAFFPPLFTQVHATRHMRTLHYAYPDQLLPASTV